MTKRNRLYLFSAMLLVCALASQATCAQTTYRIKESKDIDMKLSGTSTLHKWTMDAKTFTGQGEFELGKNETLQGLHSMTFALNVKDLKSGDKGLDKNAYKALKATEFKDILYKLSSATVGQETNGKYLVKTKGDLTIAGVTHVVDMNVYFIINKDGTISCSGSEKLKMTDYQVKPPSFMLGAMKTGDDITLDFRIIYSQ